MNADKSQFRMFVRFTGETKTYKSELEQFMNEPWVEQFIMVHHTGDSEDPHDHLHFMVIAYRSYDTITNYMKKIQSLKKLKKQYRTERMGDTDEDYANVGSYLFNTKNGNVATYVMSKGISEDIIVAWKHQANEITKAFTDKEMSRKREMKLNAKTSKKILSQIIEECRPAPQTLQIGPILEERIITMIVAKYNENLMKAPPRSSMTSMVLTCLSRWGYTQKVVEYYMKDFQSRDYNNAY